MPSHPARVCKVISCLGSRLQTRFRAEARVVDEDGRVAGFYIVGVPRFRSPARLWMLNGVCDLRFSSSRDLLLWFVTAAVTATQGDIEVISAKSIRTRVLSLARTRL